MMYLLLIIGFFLLVKGADYFVEGSSAVARLLKVPSVVIGLTIVAMGTSAPEAAVSITAGLAGSNELALSNVIGSNLFNLVLIVGVCALIRPFIVDQSIMKRDFPIAILSSILLLFFIRDDFLSRIEGLILLILMAAYLVMTVISAIRNPIEIEERDKFLPMHTSLLYILLGLAGIIVGGNLVVDNACRVAAAFGLSETLIGLTIVAIGTSLPELVTSVTASRKGGKRPGPRKCGRLQHIQYYVYPRHVLRHPSDYLRWGRIYGYSDLNRFNADHLYFLQTSRTNGTADGRSLHGRLSGLLCLHYIALVRILFKQVS